VCNTKRRMMMTVACLGSARKHTKELSTLTHWPIHPPKHSYSRRPIAIQRAYPNKNSCLQHDFTVERFGHEELLTTRKYTKLHPHSLPCSYSRRLSISQRAYPNKNFCRWQHDFMVERFGHEELLATRKYTKQHPTLTHRPINPLRSSPTALSTPRLSYSRRLFPGLRP
jgi:hypothetical protein